ncbi:50S ribosomal protein L25 [Sporolactobacillus terrae]|uniref:Large ribosomal subunit protein bL25 n=1 Tax=Sporolactobacillus terrae TaxID=269673 RepID=A0A410D547_9BACL|nr:50S ribosomal protein L25 [Sporolactobacillus terrae]QAA21219.1 50S ribosomal protein L25 [Sporolactobacillus terrae]QAA24191.1 50S ribosomal protein L25 [Sporolactobacillus terrae]UAK16000.1 50S ribosomal protein L25 [Sporolactobacillus terrae]BBN97358.1 general stress protein CTC [Sporolactobacillus terrae]
MATLNAAIRNNYKKSYTKQLRKEGKVPSVVYGKTVGNEGLAVDAQAIDKLFRDEGRNAIINLAIEGKKKYTVMAHDLQFDPLKGNVRHIDFLEINMNEEIDAVVPVILKGVEQVESGDAVLNNQLSELTVRALPNKLPSAIEVDVTKLSVGDSIRISDLASTAKDYTILGDAEDAIVSLSYGSQEAAAPEEETAEDTAAEPTSTDAAE